MRLQGLGVLTLVLSGMCLPAYSTESTECHSGISQLNLQESADTALPVRKGPRVQTSGRVPHVQVGVDLSHTTMLLAKVFRHWIVNWWSCIAIWVCSQIHCIRL